MELGRSVLSCLRVVSVDFWIDQSFIVIFARKCDFECMFCPEERPGSSCNFTMHDAQTGYFFVNFACSMIVISWYYAKLYCLQLLYLESCLKVLSNREDSTYVKLGINLESGWISPICRKSSRLALNQNFKSYPSSMSSKLHTYMHSTSWNKIIHPVWGVRPLFVMSAQLAGLSQRTPLGLGFIFFVW